MANNVDSRNDAIFEAGTLEKLVEKAAALGNKVTALNKFLDLKIKEERDVDLNDLLCICILMRGIALDVHEGIVKINEKVAIDIFENIFIPFDNLVALLRTLKKIRDKRTTREENS